MLNDVGTSKQVWQINGPSLKVRSLHFPINNNQTSALKAKVKFPFPLSHIRATTCVELYSTVRLMKQQLQKQQWHLLLLLQKTVVMKTNTRANNCEKCSLLIEWKIQKYWHLESSLSILNTLRWGSQNISPGIFAPLWWPITYNFLSRSLPLTFPVPSQSHDDQWNWLPQKKSASIPMINLLTMNLVWPLVRRPWADRSCDSSS